MAGDNKTTKLFAGEILDIRTPNRNLQGHGQGLSPYRLFHSLEQAQHKLSQYVKFAF